jgi:hypothetical protein
LLPYYEAEDLIYDPEEADNEDGDVCDANAGSIKLGALFSPLEGKM